MPAFSIPLLASLTLLSPGTAPGPSMASKPTQVQSPGQPPAPGPSWEATYNRGRGLFISGIVVTGAGALVTAGSGFFILLSLAMGDTGAVLPGAGWAALAGGCVMLVGIPLLVTGIVLKRRASRMKAGVAMDIEGSTFSLRF